MYSGYVTVDADAGRELFFVLAEALADAGAKPLMLWLNGGPGCSSLLGMLSELGPYYPDPAGGGAALVPNWHAWTREVNLVALESPAMVGFSRSATPGDAAVGDERTARDALRFVLEFLTLFPEYQARPLIVAGESYGGHYVPNLAAAVVEFNAGVVGGRWGIPEAWYGEFGFEVQLDGVMVGDPWTVPAVDTAGMVVNAWARGEVSDEAMAGVLTACDLSTLGPVLEEEGAGADPLVALAAAAAGATPAELAARAAGQSCEHYVEMLQSDMGMIDIYDVYEDVCLDPATGGLRSPGTRYPEQMARALGDSPAALPWRAALGRAGRLAGAAGDPVPENAVDPCVDSLLSVWLNDPAVQRALHAIGDGEPAVEWAMCSAEVQYSRESLLTPMIPVYRELLAAEINVLVFVGDVDGILPILGTRVWVTRLGLPTARHWAPWTDYRGQVGGYSVAYEGRLTLATVRNAGHMVPYTQSGRSLDLLRGYLDGTWFEG